MDRATSAAIMDNSSASNRGTEQVTFTEARLNEPEDSITQVNPIYQMFSVGYDYAFIEQHMNGNHAPVSSVVRQELWLMFNHERLSESLRWHHSQVLDLVRSDPATSNRPDLLLTDNHCAVMRNEMKRRLQEVEQSFQGLSGVQWGAKLRNYAKWEYLKDEIVLLYKWLKQQNTYGRGINTVCAEMIRRYGELFDYGLGVHIHFSTCRMLIIAEIQAISQSSVIGGKVQAAPVVRANTQRPGPNPILPFSQQHPSTITSCLKTTTGPQGPRAQPKIFI
jgi:hypothetical protein